LSTVRAFWDIAAMTAEAPASMTDPMAIVTPPQRRITPTNEPGGELNGGKNDANRRAVR
jgi:hypothetical protein